MSFDIWAGLRSHEMLWELSVEFRKMVCWSWELKEPLMLYVYLFLLMKCGTFFMSVISFPVRMIFFACGLVFFFVEGFLGGRYYEYRCWASTV